MYGHLAWQKPAWAALVHCNELSSDHNVSEDTTNLQFSCSSICIKDWQILLKSWSFSFLSFCCCSFFENNSFPGFWYHLWGSMSVNCAWRWSWTIQSWSFSSLSQATVGTRLPSPMYLWIFTVLPGRGNFTVPGFWLLFQSTVSPRDHLSPQVFDLRAFCVSHWEP